MRIEGHKGSRYAVANLCYHFDSKRKHLRIIVHILISSMKQPPELFLLKIKQQQKKKLNTVL